MRLRDLPSVDELARGVDDPLAVAAARAVLERAREEIRAGAEPGDLLGRLAAELAAARRPALRRVLNATGVVVHTNLGRAPLPEAALERVRAAAGYANLEYDLSSGSRGSRQDHLAPLLRRLTGAESALVVNNNAAALLLALAALAEGREVVVSRGVGSPSSSTRAPEPRSSTSGTSCRRATAASSAAPGRSAKPTTRKLEGWTRRRSAVSGPTARS